MPAAPLLPKDQISAGLASLRGWQRDGNAIAKTFKRRDFSEAVAFVGSLVAPADEQNHHPDVVIRWNEVTLRLWTHASGGLTERDLRLARTIDEMTED
jgi:4a-hydroxytetrahydrobiopterin dehydratase